MKWDRQCATGRRAAWRMRHTVKYLKRGDASAGLPFAREAVDIEPASFVAHNALGVRRIMRCLRPLMRRLAAAWKLLASGQSLRLKNQRDGGR